MLKENQDTNSIDTNNIRPSFRAGAGLGDRYFAAAAKIICIIRTIEI
ncbi:hypothetical protein AB2762_06305 [Acinetobacter indicus]